MLRFKYLIVVILVLFAAKQWKNSVDAKQRFEIVSEALAGGQDAMLKTGIPTNCHGKMYCLTVFVAPWCPACNRAQASFPMIQKYLEQNRKDIGFGIVVGADTKEQIEQKRSEMKQLETISDESKEIFRSRNISSFPTWVSTNALGRELNRISGGYIINHESQIPAVIDKYLGK